MQRKRIGSIWFGDFVDIHYSLIALLCHVVFVHILAWTAAKKETCVS